MRFNTESGVVSIPESVSVSTSGHEPPLSDVLRPLPPGAILQSLASSGEETDSEEQPRETARRFLPLCVLSGSLKGVACRTFRVMNYCTGGAAADGPGAATAGAAASEP